MNGQFFKLVFLAELTLSVSAMGSYGQIITSVPFTITQSGTYTFSKSLTFVSTSGGHAITVAASDVVIDFRGFSLNASPVGAGIGVQSSNRGVNIIVRNGAISGFKVGLTIVSDAVGCTIDNVRFLNNGTGINLQGSTSCTVQNCLVIGSGTGTGIMLTACSGVEVKNTQLLNWSSGVTSDGNNAFLENYIGGCSAGLQLGTGDKYQGNVTNGCTTPFSGGTAVGTENN
jgi:parallel beta-helix repeat protein